MEFIFKLKRNIKNRIKNKPILFDGDNLMFKNHCNSINKYAEYGAGLSTEWVFNNTKADILSIDTNDLYFLVSDVHYKRGLSWNIQPVFLPVSKFYLLATVYVYGTLRVDILVASSFVSYSHIDQMTRIKHFLQLFRSTQKLNVNT